MISERLRTIMLAMADETVYYTNHSPRIFIADVEEIRRITGVDLIYTHTFGASNSPQAVIPKDREHFRKRVLEMIKE